MGAVNEGGSSQRVLKYQKRREIMGIDVRTGKECIISSPDDIIAHVMANGDVFYEHIKLNVDVL